MEKQSVGLNLHHCKAGALGANLARARALNSASSALIEGLPRWPEGGAVPCRIGSTLLSGNIRCPCSAAGPGRSGGTAARLRWLPARTEPLIGNVTGRLASSSSKRGRAGCALSASVGAQLRRFMDGAAADQRRQCRGRP